MRSGRGGELRGTFSYPPIEKLISLPVFSLRSNREDAIRSLRVTRFRKQARVCLFVCLLVWGEGGIEFVRDTE